MKKEFFLCLIVIFFSIKVYSQNFFKKASYIYYSKKSFFPTVVIFNEVISIQEIEEELLQNNITFKRIKSEKDNLGYIHYTYQQTYGGINIEWAIFKVQQQKNKTILSGNIYENIFVNNSIKKSFFEVYNKLLGQINAKKLCEKEIIDSNLIILRIKEKFYYAYKINLCGIDPFFKKTFYLDAEDSEVLLEIDNIKTDNYIGIAETRYSGTQEITTYYSSGVYKLRDNTRGGGIFTLNLNNGTNYEAATDFLDDDNYWNNYNAQQDEVATDAHWGAEKFYDFLIQKFNRNSIDNNGFPLYNYIHANLVSMGFPNNVNAFWDGERATFGDGNQYYSPLTAIDIVAHEFTHGLIEHTANLIYVGESGAINEGFADIFACAVEHYSKPQQANWTIAEDIGQPFRSIQNPKDYGHPDTYKGIFWDFNEEVHRNSTVFSHWFYIVSEGKTGINDIGNSYSVEGIGLEKAIQIAYRMLNYYLTPQSDYYETRIFAILSASDLFGNCSPEVETVTNAMYAVGIGDQYIPAVIANFYAPVTFNCSNNFVFNFINTSVNASSFYWSFGDGNYSTEMNPSHVYQQPGTYTVSLIVNGGSCGIDTIIKNDYIKIDSTLLCNYIMPLNDTFTIYDCEGYLFDIGGPTNDYLSNSFSIVTINPPNATGIVLNFLEFDIEPGDTNYCNYDYIEIFDGPNTNSPSLGRYCNTTGPPSTIQTSTNSVTLLFYSDVALNKAGFKLHWKCNAINVPPIANFQINYINECSGKVSFKDLSFNSPTFWIWDFGDGNYSYSQNPTHIYSNSGIYTVTLIVGNEFGTDTIVKENLVFINLLPPPNVNDTIVCIDNPLTLISNSSGLTYWYYNYYDTLPFFVGDTLYLPPLTNNQIFWVQNVEIFPFLYVGNSFYNSYGGYFNNYPKHYLVFDCFKKCELISVLVNAASSGYRLIELQNSNGEVLQNKLVFIPEGISRVYLNFQIPVANDLRLVGPSYPDLWRNNSNCNYPYVLENVISIKHSSAPNNPTGYYYYFYDWEIKIHDCVSPKIPVNILVDTCLFLNQNNLFEIIISPKITNNYINVFSQRNEVLIKSIKILNYAGEPILSLDKLNITKVSLNLSHLPKGLYFIEVDYFKNICYSKKIEKFVLY